MRRAYFSQNKSAKIAQRTIQRLCRASRNANRYAATANGYANKYPNGYAKCAHSCAATYSYGEIVYHGLTRRCYHYLRLRFHFQMETLGFFAYGGDASFRRVKYLFMGAIVPLWIFFFSRSLNLCTLARTIVHTTIYIITYFFKYANKKNGFVKFCDFCEKITFFRTYILSFLLLKTISTAFHRANIFILRINRKFPKDISPFYTKVFRYLVA